MYIIYLKFGPNRGQAGQWMAGHMQWIQQGIEDGIFLLTGSLDAGLGGVVLAANVDRCEIDRRVDQDPFVTHEVVTVEVHPVAPSRMSQGMAVLLDKGNASEPAS